MSRKLSNKKSKSNKSNKLTKSKKKESLKPELYDFIIIGGGISGLYTAYKLLQKNNKRKILILEKNDYLGGRIKTINYKGEVYEAGAARFNTDQTKIINLINELGLADKKIELTNTTNSIFHPQNKFPLLNKKYPLFDDLIKDLTKKKIPKSELQKSNIISLVDKYLKTKDVIEAKENIKKFCEEKYPYYSEIAILNGYNALKLFNNDLNTTTKYYILYGGLSQLIDKLEFNIKKNGGKIKKKYNVETINEISVENNKKNNKHDNDNNFYCINNIYNARNIICALPKHALKNISFFNNINGLLNSIVCQPLYRIYAKYPVINGKCWFHDLPKSSTNLPIKFFIPYNYDTGFIMISYTDSKYADFWLDMIDSEDKLKSSLKYYLQKMFPDKVIPDPLWIKHHYWKHGAGYWKKNKDSDKLIPKIIKPISNKNVFICGENYSDHQAWIEGALQTSDMVLQNF